jgi:hypothetical protein
MNLLAERQRQSLVAYFRNLRRAVAVYAGLVLVMQYLFQFDKVSEHFRTNVFTNYPDTWRQIIGLADLLYNVTDASDRFNATYRAFIEPAMIMCLCVCQIDKSNKASNLSEMPCVQNSRLLEHMPIFEIMVNLTHFLKLLCILFIGYVVMLMAVVSSALTVSAAGLVFVLVALYFLKTSVWTTTAAVSPQGRRRLLKFALYFCAALVLFLFFLRFMEYYAFVATAYRTTQKYVGFRSTASNPTVLLVEVTVRHLLILLLLGLYALSMHWKLEVDCMAGEFRRQRSFRDQYRSSATFATHHSGDSSAATPSTRSRGESGAGWVEMSVLCRPRSLSRSRSGSAAGTQTPPLSASPGPSGERKRLPAISPGHGGGHARKNSPRLSGISLNMLQPLPDSVMAHDRVEDGDGVDLDSWQQLPAVSTGHHGHARKNSPRLSAISLNLLQPLPDSAHGDSWHKAHDRVKDGDTANNLDSWQQFGPIVEDEDYGDDDDDEGTGLFRHGGEVLADNDVDDTEGPAAVSLLRPVLLFLTNVILTQNLSSKGKTSFGGVVDKWVISCMYIACIVAALSCSLLNKCNLSGVAYAVIMGLLLFARKTWVRDNFAHLVNVVYFIVVWLYAGALFGSLEMEHRDGSMADVGATYPSQETVFNNAFAKWLFSDTTASNFLYPALLMNYVLAMLFTSMLAQNAQYFHRVTQEEAAAAAAHAHAATEEPCYGSKEEGPPPVVVAVAPWVVIDCSNDAEYVRNIMKDMTPLPLKTAATVSMRFDHAASHLKRVLRLRQKGRTRLLSIFGQMYLIYFSWIAYAIAFTLHYNWFSLVNVCILFVIAGNNFKQMGRARRWMWSYLLMSIVASYSLRLVYQVPVFDGNDAEGSLGTFFGMRKVGVSEGEILWDFLGILLGILLQQNVRTTAFNDVLLWHAIEDIQSSLHGKKLSKHLEDQRQIALHLRWKELHNLKERLKSAVQTRLQEMTEFQKRKAEYEGTEVHSSYATVAAPTPSGPDVTNTTISTSTSGPANAAEWAKAYEEEQRAKEQEEAVVAMPNDLLNSTGNDADTNHGKEAGGAATDASSRPATSSVPAGATQLPRPQSIDPGPANTAAWVKEQEALAKEQEEVRALHTSLLDTGNGDDDGADASNNGQEEPDRNSGNVGTDTGVFTVASAAVTPKKPRLSLSSLFSSDRLKGSLGLAQHTPAPDSNDDSAPARARTQDLPDEATVVSAVSSLPGSTTTSNPSPSTTTAPEPLAFEAEKTNSEIVTPASSLTSTLGSDTTAVLPLSSSRTENSSGPSNAAEWAEWYKEQEALAKEQEVPVPTSLEVQMPSGGTYKLRKSLANTGNDFADVTTTTSSATTATPDVTTINNDVTTTTNDVTTTTNEQGVVTITTTTAAAATSEHNIDAIASPTTAGLHADLNPQSVSSSSSPPKISTTTNHLKSILRTKSPALAEEDPPRRSVRFNSVENTIYRGRRGSTVEIPKCVPDETSILCGNVGISEDFYRPIFDPSRHMHPHTPQSVAESMFQRGDISEAERQQLLNADQQFRTQETDAHERVKKNADKMYEDGTINDEEYREILESDARYKLATIAKEHQPKSAAADNAALQFTNGDISHAEYLELLKADARFHELLSQEEDLDPDYDHDTDIDAKNRRKRASSVVTSIKKLGAFGTDYISQAAYLITQDQLAVVSESDDDDDEDDLEDDELYADDDDNLVRDSFDTGSESSWRRRVSDPSFDPDLQNDAWNEDKALATRKRSAQEEWSTRRRRRSSASPEPYAAMRKNSLLNLLGERKGSSSGRGSDVGEGPPGGSFSFTGGSGSGLGRSRRSSSESGLLTLDQLVGIDNNFAHLDTTTTTPAVDEAGDKIAEDGDGASSPFSLERTPSSYPSSNHMYLQSRLDWLADCDDSDPLGKADGFDDTGPTASHGHKRQGSGGRKRDRLLSGEKARRRRQRSSSEGVPGGSSRKRAPSRGGVGAAVAQGAFVKEGKGVAWVIANDLWLNVAHLFQANSLNVVYIIILLCYLVEPTMRSMVLLFALFGYALLQNPRQHLPSRGLLHPMIQNPPKKFWRCLLRYAEVCLIWDFLAQFGQFCGNGGGGINAGDGGLSEAACARKDFISYFIMDWLLLAALLMHISMLKRRGAWNYRNYDTKEGMGLGRVELSRAGADTTSLLMGLAGMRVTDVDVALEEGGVQAAVESPDGEREHSGNSLTNAHDLTAARESSGSSRNQSDNPRSSDLFGSPLGNNDSMNDTDTGTSTTMSTSLTSSLTGPFDGEPHKEDMVYVDIAPASPVDGGTRGNGAMSQVRKRWSTANDHSVSGPITFDGGDTAEALKKKRVLIFPTKIVLTVLTFFVHESFLLF